MNQWSYVIAAYALTWVVLAAYAIYVWRRSREAEVRAREAGVTSERES